MIRSNTFGVLFLAAVGAATFCGVAASAEDFRVDNLVFFGDQKEPISRSTTIFHENAVYDCMKEPVETVVFERKIDQFTLLNLKNRLRTQLSTGEVASFIDRMQLRAGKSRGDPIVKFLAGPKFQEQDNTDETAGQVILNSPLVTYRLTLVPEQNPKIVQQYHEFRDWSARLNSLLVPGSQPPFGRLVVNAAMAKRQATVSSVVLTMTTGKGSKQQQITSRSEHRLCRQLDPIDLERVSQTREMMDRFKLVAFDEYRKNDPR